MGTEMLPVVTTKSSEVYYWGGGKVTPQKIDTFQKARSAIQVGQSYKATPQIPS